MNDPAFQSGLDLAHQRAHYEAQNQMEAQMSKFAPMKIPFPQAILTLQQQLAAKDATIQALRELVEREYRGYFSSDDSEGYVTAQWLVSPTKAQLDALAPEAGK